MDDAAKGNIVADEVLNADFPEGLFGVYDKIVGDRATFSRRTPGEVGLKRLGKVVQ